MTPGFAAVRRSLQAGALGVVLIVTTCQCGAQPEPDITLYTTSSIPVVIGEGRSVRVVRLDDALRMQRELSAGLPANQVAAEALMRQRMASPEGRRLQADLQAAFEQLLEAEHFGVDRVPAVVLMFNGQQQVVYGARSIDAALASWRQWMEMQNCVERETCAYSTFVQ